MRVSPVTDLDLDAIKARAEAATKGPWWAWDRGVGWHIAIGEPTEGAQGRPARLLPASERTDISRQADAEFIAAARTDVPALIAEVERQGRLLADPFPASDEAMVVALGEERATAEQLRHLLAEVLGHFHRYAMDGDRVISMRSEAVPAEAYQRWRSWTERS